MSMSMDGDDHAAASLLLNHTYLYQEKTMEEMKQSLVLAIQLQQTRLKSRDQQILQLKHQLAAAIKDRDEAELNCRKALFEKLLLQHQLKHSLLPSHPNSAVDGFSSDNSIVSKPEFPVEIKGPLPEKGRFLQAVRNSGPLLETLLLAGPLPQWRHPPPPLHPCQIPPPPLQPQILHEDGNNVKRWARNRITRKRGLGDGPFEFDRSEESKHRRSLMFLQ